MSKVTAQAGKASKPATPKELTGKERSALRALGHALSPVVHIGKAGLTPGVTRELQGALKAHELVKVQLLGECPIERTEAAERIAKATVASVVQALGKTLLFYKPNLEKPKVSLDAPGSSDARVVPRKAASKGVRPKHKAASSRRSDSPGRRPDSPGRRSDSPGRRSDSPGRRSDSSRQRPGATSRYSRSSGNKK